MRECESVVLRPMFCTWSSLFVWALAAVAHVLAPYSSVGRTVQVYTVFRIRGDTPQCVPESRFSRASFWMPLFSLTQFVVSMRGGSLVWLLRRLVSRPVVVFCCLA